MFHYLSRVFAHFQTISGHFRTPSTTDPQPSLYPCHQCHTSVQLIAFTQLGSHTRYQNIISNSHICFYFWKKFLLLLGPIPSIHFNFKFSHLFYFGKNSSLTGSHPQCQLIISNSHICFYFLVPLFYQLFSLLIYFLLIARAPNGAGFTPTCNHQKSKLATNNALLLHSCSHLIHAFHTGVGHMRPGSITFIHNSDLTYLYSYTRILFTVTTRVQPQNGSASSHLYNRPASALLYHSTTSLHLDSTRHTFGSGSPTL